MSCLGTRVIVLSWNYSYCLGTSYCIVTIVIVLSWNYSYCLRTVCVFSCWRHFQSKTTVKHCQVKVRLFPKRSDHLNLSSWNSFKHDKALILLPLNAYCRVKGRCVFNMSQTFCSHIATVARKYVTCFLFFPTRFSHISLASLFATIWFWAKC